MCCETYLARDIEIRLVLKRALEHPAIILNKVEIDGSLSRWPVRVFDQSLRRP